MIEVLQMKVDRGRKIGAKRLAKGVIRSSAILKIVEEKDQAPNQHVNGFLNLNTIPHKLSLATQISVSFNKEHPVN